MQLFGESEGAFYIGLPFRHTPLAQWAGQPFLSSLDKLLRPRAVDSSFSA
jgi:hypothetical protein